KEQQRRRSYPVAVHHRQVGVADTARLDANHDLTAARIVQLQLDDAEWAGFGLSRRPGCEPWWNTGMTSVPSVSPVSSAPTVPPAPDTLTSSDFPVLWPVGTRWADNDMFGHLNNAVYYQLFDTAIDAWINTSTGVDPITTPSLGIVAESGCRYFCELHFPQSLVVGL